MAKRFRNTSNRRTQQVVRDAAKQDINAGIRIAIASLQAQLNKIRTDIANLVISNNQNATAGGQIGVQYDPVLITRINRTGVTRENGEVVVQDTATADGFTTTETASFEDVIGTVWNDSPNGTSAAVEVGSASVICTGGFGQVFTNADVRAVSIGDKLIPHSVSGQAVTAEYPTQMGVFATAIEALTSGQVSINAVIHPKQEYRNVDMWQRATVKFNYDTDGSQTGFSGHLTSARVYRTSALSTLIEAHYYHYSADGLLQSAFTSAYDVAGNGLNTISHAIEMQSERVSQIIRDIT